MKPKYELDKDVAARVAAYIKTDKFKEDMERFLAESEARKKKMPYTLNISKFDEPITI